jgi:transcription termination factor Rho
VPGAKVKESGTFLNHSLGFLFRLPGRLHEAYLFIVQKSALLCAVICVYMGKTVAEIPEFGSGFLEISEKGFGFLRSEENRFQPKPTDIFVTPDTIKRRSLREGSYVHGTLQPPHRGTSPQLKEVLTVNEMPYDEFIKASRFENLVTIDPVEKFRLETTPEQFETRIIDLVTPIGKGTRGLIVAPPRTGKTTILKLIANAIALNHPEVYVMVLLIDERPEEVTDFERSVKAEVVASSNDQDLETHVRLSRFTIERCRRMVEGGRDVIVLMDSLTRVARAYNSAHGGSGRTMTGGVDARALEIPRKMFAAARKIEFGGSLTIIATALVETGSRMDELIFQEFKGTGNMELILDRKLADRRLFPAIDIPRSGTRKEEKLYPGVQIEAVRKLRRSMVDLNSVEAMETLIGALKKYKTNEELLSKLL